ncbi:hypothetical protein C2R22_17370 [Salinigranum rubrum]|uniref:SHOCT domain-containing protein n=1 Tax=Salinigranum rubrum TaxID=755307 RepID=A0A2I8VMS8_9EURY|nr:SHOCT domain-containing protein [Salinigranum rubrum]AUV83195.1 hypothetical protein C2R22_17370 [Salinigranum rubrum]
MALRRTHGAHLAAWVVTVLLVVPLLGLSLWGSWRLLFWGVVAAAPHAHYGPAAGTTAPGAMPPGVDAMLVGGAGSSAGVSLTMLVVVGFLVLVCVLLAMSAVAARTDDALATLEEAYVRGELDDEEYTRRRRTLVGERPGRTS